MKQTWWIAGIMGLAMAAFAQTAAAPVFDVAAIRLTTPQRTQSLRFLPGGRLSAMTSIQLAIREAYGVQSYQVTGGPDWITTDRYTIEAKTDKTDASQEEMRAMLQTLLADRFKLRVRQETKAFDAYNLIVNKGGPKLKPLAKGEDQHCTVNNSFVCGITDMGTLARSLKDMVGRPVIDKTGIEGRYNVLLDFDTYSAEGRTPPEGYDKPSLQHALEDQLGLRMVPAKMAMPVYVVESISRPSEN
jgi:uncharacterized protein (TIGR03435 family)